MTATTVAPGITSDPDIQGGEPCIAGTRIPAMNVWRAWREGWGSARIAEAWPTLIDNNVLSAIAYGAAQNARTKPASDGGPAFPDPGPVVYVTEGVSRAEAAIRLRVPDSGEDWLNDMIREARRAWFAGQALAGLLAGEPPSSRDIEPAGYAHDALQYADALLAALEAGHD